MLHFSLKLDRTYIHHEMGFSVRSLLRTSYPVYSCRFSQKAISVRRSQCAITDLGILQYRE